MLNYTALKLNNNTDKILYKITTFLIPVILTILFFWFSLIRRYNGFTLILKTQNIIS